MGDIVKRRTSDGQSRYYVRYLDADGKRKMRNSKQENPAKARQYLATIEARIERGLIGIP